MVPVGIHGTGGWRAHDALGWRGLDGDSQPQPMAALWGFGHRLNDVWAVGEQSILHWDGSRWNLIPNAGGLDELPSSVTAIAPNDAWGVGDNGQTQHWN
jgi:hypothetical protein